jgi:hypothetical protein
VKSTVRLVVAVCLLGASAWFVNRNPPEAIVPAIGETQEAAASTAPAEQEKYRKVVTRALDYLEKHQFDDGRWEDDAGNHPVAMTALAGLAVLLGRDSPYRFWTDDPPLEKKTSDCIRKATDWVMAYSRPERDGLIFSDHPSESSSYMQGHALATIFLAGAWKQEKDDARQKKLTEALTRAVTYIAQAQTSQGGWHGTSRAEGHDLATVQPTILQVQALQAAENVSVPIPTAVLSDGYEFLKASLKKDMNAVDLAGILASRRRAELGDARHLISDDWLAECRSRIPRGSDLQVARDALDHYYWIQVMLDEKGWDEYRIEIVDRLHKTQNDDGSWPAGDGLCAGRIYSTALWCAVLQIGAGNHPSKQHSQFAIE